MLGGLVLAPVVYPYCDPPLLMSMNSMVEMVKRWMRRWKTMVGVGVGVVVSVIIVVILIMEGGHLVVVRGVWTSQIR